MSAHPSRYRVTLTAEFTFSIDEVIETPAGATQAQIEEIIDRNWGWISGSTDVLLESRWELESYEAARTEPD